MTSTDHDLVILVDESDLAVGILDKLAAHRRGLLHRAISVIVEDGAGRLLLQKRAAAKYHSGGLWTNTCCSHPRPGEAVSVAAERRLKEEMGITLSLTPLFVARYHAPVSNGLVENELVHVFGGRFAEAPLPDPGEAEDWRYAGIDSIEREIAAEPDRFSIWFRKYLMDFRGALPTGGR